MWGIYVLKKYHHPGLYPPSPFLDKAKKLSPTYEQIFLNYPLEFWKTLWGKSYTVANIDEQQRTICRGCINENDKITIILYFEYILKIILTAISMFALKSDA